MPPPTDQVEHALPAALSESVSLAVGPGRDRRRILVVAPQPFYSDRGTPIALRQVVEALGQLGYETDVLTYPVGEDIQVPGLRIIRAANPLRLRWVPIGLSWRKLALDVPLVLELASLLRRGDYFCVQAVEEMAFPAVLLARGRNRAVVYDMQSSLPEQLARLPLLGGRLVQALLVRCESWLLRRADFVVSSAGLAPRVRKAVPDADVREWRFPGEGRPVSAHEVAGARESIGLAPGTPVVVYAGNFEPYQGLDELIRAVPCVVAEVPDVAFVLVGGSRLPLESTRRVADGWIRSNHLRLVPPQPRDRVAAFLAMADVLVSPRQRGENLPLKVFEYLSAGRPIVATDIPTHRAVFEHGTALLVAPDRAGLADGILRLLQSPERARELAKAAGCYAREHLGWIGFLVSMSRLLTDVENRVEGAGARRGRRASGG